MKKTVLATYERTSTLWKNANGFYKCHDYVKMECAVVDYSEDLKFIEENGIRWLDANDNDVTDREIEKRYGKTYLITLMPKAGIAYERCEWFKTKDEANNFFRKVMNDKVLGNFRRVK